MIQGHEYIFAIVDKSNNFYRLMPDGSVSLSANPYFLEFSPSGWDDIAIQNVRNSRYWGIDRSVSIPLAYVQDGAKIVKHILYNQGIYASAYLVIAHQQLEYEANVSYGFWYKMIYKGEFDLSSFNHSSSKVTLSTLEDGLAKYLKSNENTTYEYPVNIPEAIKVKMDGINLHEKLVYQELFNFPVNITNYGKRFRMPTSFIISEGDSTGIVHQSQNIVPTGGMSWEDEQTLDNYLLKNVNS